MRKRREEKRRDKSEENRKREEKEKDKRVKEKRRGEDEKEEKRGRNSLAGFPVPQITVLDLQVSTVDIRKKSDAITRVQLQWFSRCLYGAHAITRSSVHMFKKIYRAAVITALLI